MKKRPQRRIAKTFVVLFNQRLRQRNGVKDKASQIQGILATAVSSIPPTQAAPVPDSAGASAATRPPGDNTGVFAPVVSARKARGNLLETTMSFESAEDVERDTYRRLSGRLSALTLDEVHSPL